MTLVLLLLCISFVSGGNEVSVIGLQPHRLPIIDMKKKKLTKAEKKQKAKTEKKLKAKLARGRTMYHQSGIEKRTSMQDNNPEAMPPS